MPTKTEAEVWQDMANELNAAIPEAWTQADMVIDYDPAGQINFENTYLTPSGEKKHVPFVPEFIELVQDLAEAVATPQSGPFKRAYFTLLKSGTFKARYSYEEEGFPERSAQ